MRSPVDCVTGIRWAVALMAGGVSVGQAQPARPHAQRVAQHVLDALVATTGVPGMGASVWRDGQVVWIGSAGQRDVERGLAVDSLTIFRLASVSKLLAATAAARLVEQGALDIDRPVQSILPGFGAGWPPLTPRQLAAHSSGMPHYQAMDLRRGGVHYSTVPQALELIRDRQLLSPPGTRYEYSSWGFTLLSAVVEKAAGRPYLDVLRTELTNGLTILSDQTGINPQASVAYEFAGNRIQRAAPHDFSYSVGGAGMSATAVDLARFGGRVLSGAIVSPSTWTWMTQPARLRDGSPVTEGDYTLGFGWRVGRDLDARPIVHHAGVTVGARSVLLLYPEQRLAVSVLSNALWVSSIEATAMTLSAAFRSTAPALPRRSCPTDVRSYVGTLAGDSIAGTVAFRVVDGLCTGTLSVTNAMGRWLNSFVQADRDTVPIVGFDADGGLSRGAVVTAIGAFEWRATAESDSYQARLGARELRVRLRKEAADTVRRP
jgi:serine beta-lactamase-like protein LACTB, mitochondrial